MNYLIFACIGLSIVVLISLFITLEKIQQGIDNIENTMDWVKRSTDNFPYIDSDIYTVFLNYMDNEYISNTSNSRIVIDYIAGMTDDFFRAKIKTK